MSLERVVLLDRAMLVVAGVLLIPILVVSALPFLPVLLVVWPMVAFAAV